MIIALGLATMGVLRVPLLTREKRLDLPRVPRGPAWAFPMGMAFAAGWAPCIGPVLATILATAAAGGRVAWGAALLILYSLGLGVPFVLLALGFARAQRPSSGCGGTGGAWRWPAGRCSSGWASCSSQGAGWSCSGRSSAGSPLTHDPSVAGSIPAGPTVDSG